MQVPALIVYVPYHTLTAFFPSHNLSIVKQIHRYFRRYIRITEAAFGSLVVLMAWLFVPCEYVFTGQHRLMKKKDRVLLMANHQIYPDWFYLWIVARHQNRHGDVKILLMSVLRYLPVLGFGMSLFEFIFLERKWMKDQSKLYKHLMTALNDNLPLWLLIYPEVS
jgi:1-acyl-sn-glycerol-3-phosphate acyltransferase